MCDCLRISLSTVKIKSNLIIECLSLWIYKNKHVIFHKLSSLTRKVTSSIPNKTNNSKNKWVHKHWEQHTEDKIHNECWQDIMRHISFLETSVGDPLYSQNAYQCREILMFMWRETENKRREFSYQQEIILVYLIINVVNASTTYVKQDRILPSLWWWGRNRLLM